MPAHVSHAMVDVFQTGFRWDVIRFPFFVAWQKYTVIVFTFDEKMRCFAIKLNAACSYLTIFILQGLRLLIRFCTTTCSLLIGIVSIIYPQGQHFYPVAMLFDVFGNRMIGMQW